MFVSYSWDDNDHCDWGRRTIKVGDAAVLQSVSGHWTGVLLDKAGSTPREPRDRAAVHQVPVHDTAYEVAQLLKGAHHRAVVDDPGHL